MAQDRKVFVGGVPQDLNQDDLYAIFSEHAGVKKAWLQKCRTTDESGNGASGPQNHRGFGFVIFHDALAIDELLGSAPSRFIVLRNGTKLEVKRALSSNKMSSPQADAADAANRVRAQPPLHMSGPPRVLPSNMARNGRPPIQADWGSRLPNNDSILRQLSLMHGAGYPLQPQGQTSPLTASLTSTPPFGPTSAATAPQIRAPAARPDGRNVPLRNAIMQFYEAHRPEKLTERDFIDFICNVYEGREAELDEALRLKYGTGLQLPQLSPSMSLTDPARLPPSDAYPGLPEAWLPGSALQQQSLQQHLQRIQQRMPLPSPWLTPSTPDVYSIGSSHASGGQHNTLFSDTEEGPDLSWIDQIVGEDGLEVSDEVVRAIIEKSSTKHRTELMQAVSALVVVLVR
ncbi:unnamed protein product [Symbiodinium natans]|uniref:RRM domain-containing protein n=1 Tax=Symbiodinium natans TaxID=878477 RepID=A0A812HTV5_9DINO|nr:unnamed protein product [Symbiodinium natans]